MVLTHAYLSVFLLQELCLIPVNQLLYSLLKLLQITAMTFAALHAFAERQAKVTNDTDVMSQSMHVDLPISACPA